MSVHIVYKQNGVKMMRPVHTREEYLALRNGGEQQAVVQAVRQGDESRKSSLVQMNYSCLPNDDGTLKGSKRMSTTVGMDIDHLKAEDMPKVKERILQKKDELGLLMLEESARGKGYHLVFRRRPELNQEDNLRWASDLLGVEYDKGAKDITRVFFTTTEAELVYLHEEIFRQTPSQLPLQGESSHSANMNTSTDVTTPLTHREGTGEGLPREGTGEGLSVATPRTLYIFDACMKEAELTADVLIVEGHRHEALKSILSVGATQLLKKSELMGVLQVRMAQNWQDKNIQQLVDDFYSKYYDPNQKMSQFQRKVLAKSLRMSPKLGDDRGLKEGMDSDGSDPQPPNLGGLCPPEMPKRLPRWFSCWSRAPPMSISLLWLTLSFRRWVLICGRSVFRISTM